MQLVEFGSIMNMAKGKKPANQSPEKRDGFMPYVDIKAFETNTIENYTDGVKCLPCNEGDILIVCDGSRSGLVGKAINGYVGSTLAKITADGMTQNYLYYFLQGKYALLNTKKKGTGTPHLNPDLLKKQMLVVPSIPEQERIVTRIEELFSELDKAVETLQTTKQQLAVYRQAVLKEAFCEIPFSEYRPLREVMQNSPQNGLYKPKSDYGSGVRILRIDGFYNGFISPTYDFKRLHVSQEEINRYSLKVNDLVVNRVNSMPYLGKCALVRKLDETTVFESNMMRFRLNDEKANPKYVTYYLSSLLGKKELTKNAKQAVNQASINQTDVGNALIPVPIDILHQKKVVEIIESRLSVCESIEQTVDTALAQADAMRQSILKQAFEGGFNQ